MKNKKRLWAQIIAILLVGLLVSGILDREFLDSLRVLWRDSDPELILENISLGLGFLALVLGLIYLVVRAARKE